MHGIAKSIECVHAESKIENIKEVEIKYENNEKYLNEPLSPVKHTRWKIKSSDTPSRVHREGYLEPSSILGAIGGVFGANNYIYVVVTCNELITYKDNTKTEESDTLKCKLAEIKEVVLKGDLEFTIVIFFLYIIFRII